MYKISILKGFFVLFCFWFFLFFLQLIAFLLGLLSMFRDLHLLLEVKWGVYY